MPGILKKCVATVYRKAAELPESLLELLERDARNANIVLPYILKCRANQTQEASSSGNTWFTITTVRSDGVPELDFLAAVTEGIIAGYPLFIYHVRSIATLSQGYLDHRMGELVYALLRVHVPIERIFSVFAVEPVTRAFSAAWTNITSVGVEIGNPSLTHEYYAACLSYCDRVSFSIAGGNQSHPQIGIRLAQTYDLEKVAALCFQFAAESVRHLYL
jgi:hypothetical protein